MTEHHTTEGRRKLAPFGNDFPEHASREPGVDRPRPVEDALAYAIDRLDRVDHIIASLQATAQRLGMQLEPLLTDGSYGRPRPGGDVDATPAAEDRRSTIAKRISELGHRADQQADWIANVERTLEDLSDALEIG